MMKIKETPCSLCKEKTQIGFIYYESIIPICLKCIKFIKKTEIKEFRKLI